MAKCNSCVHFDVCQKYNATVDFDVDDGVCLHYEKQVVRCKDCKHWKCWRSSEEGTGDCLLDEDYAKLATQHYDFCSYGERKENA